MKKKIRLSTHIFFILVYHAHTIIYANHHIKSINVVTYFVYICGISPSDYSHTFTLEPVSVERNKSFSSQTIKLVFPNSRSNLSLNTFQFTLNVGRHNAINIEFKTNLRICKNSLATKLV